MAAEGLRVAMVAKKAKTINSIADLTPDTRNANKGTVRGLAMLEDSLGKYGAGRSILTDKHGNVIAGNKTLQSAVDAGIPIEVVQSDGNKLVVVQRTDLDLYADTKARELAYADNRVAQVDLDWSAEALLADVNDGLDLSKFFDDDELAELLSSVTDDPPADPGAQIDRAEELQAKWQVKRGDLYVIPSKSGKGEHRLLCGDSTSAEDVARVMGGKRASLLASDPPYNVDIAYGDNVDDIKSTLEYETFSRAWLSAWQAVSDRQVITPGCNNLASWLRWFDAYHVAPWVKTNAMTNGKVSRWWCWEPIVFFGEQWTRNRPSDVFDHPVPPQKAEGLGSLTPYHPCPKPVDMWVDLIENYTEPGAIVADAFDGSGTTLVAAERVRRRAYVMEIEPKYVAVALERLQAMGLSPVKAEM